MVYCILKLKFKYFRIAQTCSFRFRSDDDEVRVKLIDFGRSCSTKITNIGRLEERHSPDEFPVQSIDLCFMKIAPWNRFGWDDSDGIFIGNLLKGNALSENYGHGEYEFVAQFQIPNRLIFTSDMFVADQPFSPNQYYHNLLIQKGMARITPNGLSDMFLHARSMDALTDAQYHWVTAYLL